MEKRKFTTVTQLHEKQNRELITYVESVLPFYAQAFRETFHTIKRDTSFNKSNYNTYLQDKYDITKRTASSIISGAQGRLNALYELKRYEQKHLENKIAYLEKELIPKLVLKREENASLLREGEFVSLIQQRNLRLKIVSKKNKLNKLKQKLSNLDYQLKTGKLKLCFGTKHLLKRNLSAFVKRRDSQLSFVGTKTETAGNSLLQLSYLPKQNQFSIKLRKDFGFKEVKGKEKYVSGQVYFRHHKDKILSILKHKNSPLSFKIIKKKNRFYLYCTFELQVEKEEYVTRSSHGTIGLDFNKGFITLSETNAYGHLVQTQFLPYRFRSGNKTKTDLQRIACHVVQFSRSKGKDLCIEDLDFKKTKSHTDTKEGKKYNQMIHSLAYRQFVEIMESAAYRQLIHLVKVNPAWTSWLAKELYCPIMKLNIHVGASYVIARRGQGLKDSV